MSLSTMPESAVASPSIDGGASGSAAPGGGGAPRPPTPGSLTGPSGTVGVPGPDRSHPGLQGYSGSRSLQWEGMPEGVRVVVSGGSFAVSTEELTSLSATLETAAQWLDDALAHASAALAEAHAAVAPPEPDTDWMQGAETDPQPAYQPGFATPPTYPLNVGTPVSSTALTFEVLRADAIKAITALTTGTGSLDDTAQSLRDLASRVTAASEEYGTAESAAGRSPAVDTLIGSARAASLGIALGLWPAVMALSLATQAYSLDGTGPLPEVLADPLQSLQTILADEGLSTWVVGDLLLIAVLVSMAYSADTGTEANVLEQYLGDVAEDLDPWIIPRLPSQVQVGSQIVATSSLTAMQRAAYYLATLSEANGAARYGERTGVTITSPAGYSITVPPGAKDPYGLNTPVQPMEFKGVKVTHPAPRPSSEAKGLTDSSGPIASLADLITYADSVEPSQPDTGAIAILRTDHADGTTSWMVVVPGTNDWGLGSSRPQDQLTNLEAVAGRPTDMEAAVVTAMRHAGIEQGQEVGIYGHSQGAMTAMSVASDPAVAEQFTISSVITTGGPTAGVTLPAHVNALRIENTSDAVPALDAAATARTTNSTVVTVDTTQADRTAYPHEQAEYAFAVRGIEGDPDIESWTETLAGLTGAKEPGTTTVEYVFDVTRRTAGTDSSGP